MKTKYTVGQLSREVKVLKNYFDIVRVVDPTVCRVVELSEADGKVNAVYADNCFCVWNKCEQCSNCTSARAKMSTSSYVKAEVKEGNFYIIHSRCVTVEGKAYALEMVKKLRDGDLLHTNEYEGMIDVSRENDSIIVDELTGVYNRRFATEHLERISAQHDNVTVCAVGIDGISGINRRYSMVAGDGVLCAAARKLKKTICEDRGERVVRYDGDVFLIIAPDANEDDFEKRIGKTVSEFRNLPVLFNESVLTFTASGGVYTYKCGSTEAKEAVLVALSKMRQAKQTAKGFIAAR